jgi:hypothetical protein
MENSMLVWILGLVWIGIGINSLYGSGPYDGVLSAIYNSTGAIFCVISLVLEEMEK